MLPLLMPPLPLPLSLSHRHTDTPAHLSSLSPSLSHTTHPPLPRTIAPSPPSLLDLQPWRGLARRQHVHSVGRGLHTQLCISIIPSLHPSQLCPLPVISNAPRCAQGHAHAHAPSSARTTARHVVHARAHEPLGQRDASLTREVCPLARLSPAPTPHRLTWLAWWGLAWLSNSSRTHST